MKMSEKLKASCHATAMLMKRLANLAESLELCITDMPMGRYNVEAGREVLRNVSEAHGLIEAIRNAHLPNVEQESPTIAAVLKRSLHSLETKMSTIGSILNSVQSLTLVRPKTLPKYVPPSMRGPSEEALA
jgi:hypothetical protein